MEKETAINILEALANGCNPQTGELLENESILNERNVIRALQFAIDNLNVGKKEIPSIQIPKEDIDYSIRLFKEITGSVTAKKVSAFYWELENSNLY